MSNLAIDQHPKLIQALSMVPYSPLFGVLWPIIVNQASYDTRLMLKKVNDYFAGLCRPHRRSDLTKKHYIRAFGNRDLEPNLPLVLDLSLDVEWRCWGADKCGFMNEASFRAFCAIGDVDPDQGREWKRDPSDRFALTQYIWLSRSKDIVFEALNDPLKRNGHCHYFGLTGVADKAVAMYNFMRRNRRKSDEIGTYYAAMSWDREFI